MKAGWKRVLTIAALLQLVAIVPAAVGWSQLPDPLAIHWDLTGTPDGYAPLWVLPLLPLSLVLLGVGISWLFAMGARPSAEGLALLLYLGSLGVALTVSTVILNAGAASWQEAAAMSWPHLTAAVLLPLAAGAGGYLLGRRWFPLPLPEPPADSPMIEVR